MQETHYLYVQSKKSFYGLKQLICNLDKRRVSSFYNEYDWIH